VAHVQRKQGGWLATHEDITERCESEARIAFLAGHDPLTGLPNRLTFREVLVRGLQALQPGAHLAIHCVDLDRFKEVNDTLGHPIGDALLKSWWAASGRTRPDSFIARLVWGCNRVDTTKYPARCRERSSLELVL
jgi:GGDEF domain-containing protein